MEEKIEKKPYPWPPKKLRDLGFTTWQEYSVWRKRNPKPKRDLYIRIGIFKPEEIFPFIGPWRKNYMGHEIRMGSQRYELFKEKGCTCVKCGIVGTFFALEKPVDRDGKGHHKNFHFNLYGINKKGEEVMLTKDHILPKSKGGTSLLSNYQTMCYQCNCEKGNKESDYYPPRDTELETAKRMVRLLLRSVLRS